MCSLTCSAIAFSGACHLRYFTPTNRLACGASVVCAIAVVAAIAFVSLQRLQLFVGLPFRVIVRRLRICICLETRFAASTLDNQRSRSQPKDRKSVV